MREPEPDTVRRARAGDLEAFEDLVRAHQAEVFRLALLLVRDRPTAEDVAQEAFVRVFRSLGGFHGQARFTTWLYSVTRNCAIDAIRRRDRRRRREAEAAPAAPASDPASGVAIWAAVDALPPDLREPFVLIEVTGLSYREASATLGVPTGTIKSRMHRAREQLIRALREDEERADEV